jgi:hypothetical protein
MYISSCAGVISSFVEVDSLIEDLRLDVVIRCLSSGTDREGHDAGGGAISNRGGLTPEGPPGVPPLDAAVQADRVVALRGYAHLAVTWLRPNLARLPLRLRRRSRDLVPEGKVVFATTAQDDRQAQAHDQRGEDKRCSTGRISLLAQIGHRER